MSRADEIFAQNMKDIMENGFWDTDLNVRPRWEDGAPAHTVKKFGIVNRYNLQEEFPILTMRRTAFKSCIDELLWIWQKKSNDVHQLSSHIWDAWADENGTVYETLPTVPDGGINFYAKWDPATNTPYKIEVYMTFDGVESVYHTIDKTGTTYMINEKEVHF